MSRVNFFFFNDPAPTEIYTLSLHDALPISLFGGRLRKAANGPGDRDLGSGNRGLGRDRKSTRLNSSHSQISYAVFCLKKKNDHIAQAVSYYRALGERRIVALLLTIWGHTST